MLKSWEASPDPLSLSSKCYSVKVSRLRGSIVIASSVCCLRLSFLLAIECLFIQLWSSWCKKVTLTVFFRGMTPKFCIIAIDSMLPCFAISGDQTANQLRERFQPTLTHALVGDYINRLIDSSLGSNWTRLYDSVCSHETLIGTQFFDFTDRSTNTTHNLYCNHGYPNYYSVHFLGQQYRCMVH